MLRIFRFERTAQFKAVEVLCCYFSDWK